MKGLRLRLEGVTKDFGGVGVLRGVNLIVRAGEVVGLRGINGSGKTTLFNIVSGLVSAQAGRISLEEEVLDGLPPYKRCRMGLGRTFQGARLFGSLTVKENIVVAALQGVTDRREARERTSKILADLSLDGIAWKKGEDLSTGYQKLVDLGRSLATCPSVLLLDEPFAALSSKTAEVARAVLKECKANGVAMIVVEHRMEALESFVDRIAVMSGGRIVEETEESAEVEREIGDEHGFDRG